MSEEGYVYTGSRKPTVWDIVDMRREASTGVVREVEWYLKKTSQDLEVSRTGVVKISGSNLSPDFVPFEDLTQGVVLGWITGSLDTASIYSDISSSFYSVLNQTASIKTPW